MSSTTLQPGDFYLTRHSNLCETHVIFHMVGFPLIRYSSAHNLNWFEEGTQNCTRDNRVSPCCLGHWRLGGAQQHELKTSSHHRSQVFGLITSSHFFVKSWTVSLRQAATILCCQYWYSFKVSTCNDPIMLFLWFLLISITYTGMCWKLPAWMMLPH